MKSSSDGDCKAMDRVKLNRRYYLHRRIKKEGVSYNPNLKTIYCPWDKPLDSLYVTELQRDYGYSIQTELY